MRLYTLRDLARETKVGEKLLRSWRTKGWLKPSAKVGEDDRYTIRSFEEACEMSLEVSAKIMDRRRPTGWARKVASETRTRSNA